MLRAAASSTIASKASVAKTEMTSKEEEKEKKLVESKAKIGIYD